MSLSHRACRVASVEFAPAPNLFDPGVDAGSGAVEGPDADAGSGFDSVDGAASRTRSGNNIAVDSPDPARDTAADSPGAAGAGAGTGSAGACQNTVCVGVVDAAGLSEEGLRSRLGVLGRGESRMAAMKSQTLAELSRRVNTAEAQRIASDELLSSRREAKRDVETAIQLEELLTRLERWALVRSPKAMHG